MITYVLLQESQNPDKETWSKLFWKRTLQQPCAYKQSCILKAFTNDTFPICEPNTQYRKRCRIELQFIQPIHQMEDILLIKYNYLLVYWDN